MGSKLRLFLYWEGIRHNHHALFQKYLSNLGFTVNPCVNLFESSLSLCLESFNPEAMHSLNWPEDGWLVDRGFTAILRQSCDWSCERSRPGSLWVSQEMNPMLYKPRFWSWWVVLVKTNSMQAVFQYSLPLYPTQWCLAPKFVSRTLHWSLYKLCCWERMWVHPRSL